MPEGEQHTGAGTGEPNQDVAYWQGEAKKAFAARDELKAKLRATEGVDIEGLRQKAARLDELEEERKLKAGEFETAKRSLIDKHAKELKDREDRLTALERQVADEKIGAAFLSASELFGPTGETILPPDVAASYFRDHVHYQDVEIAGKTIRTVVVTDTTGNIVQGSDGTPLPIADALRAVIAGLPSDKQARILRGSGKTGSGSAGSGGAPAADLDLDGLLARVKAGDKDAIERLRQRQASMGGMVMGSAWDKRTS